MNDPIPLRFPDRDARAAYLKAQLPQLLAYIEQHLGPVLGKQTSPDALYQEVCALALESPEPFELPGRDPYQHLCRLAEQRIMEAHRRFVAAHKRKSSS